MRPACSPIVVASPSWGFDASADMLDTADAIKAAAAEDAAALAKCHMVVLVDDVRDPVLDYG
jgi:hypothetical protein